MKLKDLRQLPNGLYTVHWKSGGSSLAAVGCNDSGVKWIAPTNWLRPLLTENVNYGQHIREIKLMERIR